MGFLYTDCGIIFKCSIYWALLILTDFKTIIVDTKHILEEHTAHVWNIVLFDMTLLKEQLPKNEN